MVHGSRVPENQGREAGRTTPQRLQGACPGEQSLTKAQGFRGQVREPCKQGFDRCYPVAALV